MAIDMDPLQKQMLDDVFDAFTMLSNSYVSLMHVEGGFTRYTPAMVEQLGLPGEYIPNGAMDWNDYLHPEDRKRYMEVMMPLLEGKTQAYDITYRVRQRTGDYCLFRAVGAVLRNADGHPSLIGGAMFNEGITEDTDPVTMLPNKTRLIKDLGKFILDGQKTVSLMVGLSGFSDINMRYGYTYGNRILQETAWTIQETVAERGEVYRLDGPTFAVVASGLSRDEMAAIYDMIKYRLQRGIEVNGIRNVLESNGGLISTFGSDADAETTRSCLAYAYNESKTRMRGELVDFNGSINYDEADSLKLLNTIRECAANECKGFSLEYLPVISATTEKPNGGEAVLVWSDEEHGRVDSADFLPYIERDFLFEEISDFILEHSFADGVKFLEADPSFLLCINVYRMQLESDYFIENLDHCLAESGFPPQQLSLKFDSGCRFAGVERMREVMDELHERGILAIIDGFGSGSNSIVFLKELPFDAVCMDSQFIVDIDKPGRELDILEHLTLMAAACVEHININGVSNARIRELARSLPFDTLQGTYFSGPLTFDEIIEKYYA